MKIILSLLFTLTSLVALAQERVIIRATSNPTRVLKKFNEVATVAKFSHIDDEYFKQLYTVELKAGVVLDSELEHKFLSDSVIQKVERTNPVEVYSVYPDQKSQVFLGESLTRYQW